MMNRRDAAALMGMAGASMILGCRRQPPPPAATGVRIAVLSPALGVTLSDLGLAPLVVGRHGYDVALPRQIPSCGDLLGIDYEALIGVRPTHVLIEWGSRDLPAKLIELASVNKWFVEKYDLRTLDDIGVSIDSLNALFDPAKGAEVRAAFDKAFAKTGDDLSAAGRVLILHELNPLGAVGPGSFHHDALVRIGATPAITEGTAHVELDIEDIAHLAPDVIVLALPRAPETPSRGGRLGPAMLADLSPALARLDIPAVRKSRVVLIDDPDCLLPATSLARFAERVRREIQ